MIKEKLIEEEKRLSGYGSYLATLVFEKDKKKLYRIRKILRIRYNNEKF